jgi:TAG lipase/steryl ester hydrolase/phospholipase A2/LPA acyltransferase
MTLFVLRVFRLWYKLSTPLKMILVKYIDACALMTMLYVLKLVLWCDPKRQTLARLRRRITLAATFPEWLSVARQHDLIAHSVAGTLYDKQLVAQKTKVLANGDPDIYTLMASVRLDLQRNFGNIVKSKVHEHCYLAPADISSYIALVTAHLYRIAASTSVPRQVRLQYFKECKRVYGQTALVLSGGASLGTFHMGVVKALFDRRQLPNVIAGTSVGAIVAAIVCVRTDSELASTFEHIDDLDVAFFTEHNAIQLLINFVKHGSVYKIDQMISRLRKVLGDFTFREALEKTGRILNVSVCPAETNEQPRLLNYLTSPDVVIWSAVAASAAFPGLFPSQSILTKTVGGVLNTLDIKDEYGRKWRDGALKMDLPIHTLTELFNCTFTIVSQCNPHLVPLLRAKKRLGRVGDVLEMELKHRCHQLGTLIKGLDWLELFSQTWEGDVTITLPFRAMNLVKVIQNPSVEDVLSAIQLGEKETWQHIWAVHCHGTIERCLNLCYHKLKFQS